MIFETPRLMLRSFTGGDLDDLWQLLSDAEVMRYCGGPLDRAQAQAWLQAAQRYEGEYGYDYWAVMEKETGLFMGQAGIIRQVMEGTAYDCLAYMICRDRWGKGLASEAAQGCLDYALKTLHLPRLHATVEEENLASQAILRKLGMIYERDIHYLEQRVRLFVLQKPDAQD